MNNSKRLAWTKGGAALISSKKRIPGGCPGLGKNAGGHHVANPSEIEGIPRRSVGSRSAARRSMTGISALAAISRTMELFPTPGAPQINAGHRCLRRDVRTLDKREGFIMVFEEK